MAAVNMARNVHVQNEISNRNGIVVALGIYHRENLASIAGADRAQRSCNFVSFRKNRRFVGRGKVLKEVDSATRRRKCLELKNIFELGSRTFVTLLSNVVWKEKSVMKSERRRSVIVVRRGSPQKIAWTSINSWEIFSRGFFASYHNT